VAAEPEAEDIALDIVYEDSDIIVIDKPRPGRASGRWACLGTFGQRTDRPLRDSLSGIGGVRRPGLCTGWTRTTGLMVAAKNDAAHQSLTAQFADHGRSGAMERGYLALVWGVPNRSAAPSMPRSTGIPRQGKMAVRDGGREAVTHWEIKETFTGRDGKPVAALLACRSRPAGPTRSGCIWPISAIL